MPIPIFTGNVVALVWDFDKTLSPHNMQAPLFAAYDVDAKVFWDEVAGLAAHYSRRGIEVSRDTLYLNHILTYVAEGKMPDLTNERLRELGSEIEFYPGIPEFLPEIKRLVETDPNYTRHAVRVEHYIVSTGLRQMILGSKVAAAVDGVWACEFIEEPAGSGYLTGQQASLGASPVSQVGYYLDNTTKTRAIWEINKGTNVDATIDVNAKIAHSDRRVPLRNMLYIADGPSDVPVFSILSQYGGRTLGVYDPGDERHFVEVKRLRDQDRVDHFTEADYEPGSGAYRWICTSVREMADIIVRDRDRALADRVQRGSRHLDP